MPEKVTVAETANQSAVVVQHEAGGIILIQNGNFICIDPEQVQAFQSATHQSAMRRPGAAVSSGAGGSIV